MASPLPFKPGIAALLRAAAAILTVLLLLGWGASAFIRVPIDGRALYERFGASVDVLQPGLHVGLPWPFATARALEYGRVHEVDLAAEGPAPANGPPNTNGPGTLTQSAENDRQALAGAGLRVWYRVGLSDADAIHAAYAVALPDDLVRAFARHIAALSLAGQAPGAVPAGSREAIAASMRGRLQLALDQDFAGLEVMDVAVGTGDAPTGAGGATQPHASGADTTDDLRAVEIGIRTVIAVEHGAAAALSAQSRAHAYALIAAAHAEAAETVSGANAELLRFRADQLAARAGGTSFLLERYFAALGAALAKAPKTIVDHRLNWPEAPVLDLRPLASAASGGGKEE